MGTRGRSPFALDYQCEHCGTNTAVNMRTGRMYGHRPAGAWEICPASATQVVDPDPDLTWESTGEPGGPRNHVLSRCPECGQDVKVGRRSGQLYSHNAPGVSENCLGSDRWVQSEDPAVGALVEVERVEEEEPEARTEVRPIQSSSSVYAIPAGLPSTGRRRK